MIETTGLADPGPDSPDLLPRSEIAARYRPDAILTLVDAKHAMDQLDTRGEARRQVGFADRLFISKTDLVDRSRTVRRCRGRLRRMNPRALQSMVAFGDVALDRVFDLGAFNLVTRA